MSETKIFTDPTWAVVELFGRSMIAGEVSEVDVAGTQMLRVDVPQVDDIPAFTKFFGGGAIYAITPTDEAGALCAVQSLRQRPVQAWVISPHAQVPARAETAPNGGYPSFSNISEWEDME